LAVRHPGLLVLLLLDKVIVGAVDGGGQGDTPGSKGSLVLVLHLKEAFIFLFRIVSSARRTVDVE